MEHNYSDGRWVEWYESSYPVYLSFFQLETHKHKIVHRDVKPANILVQNNMFATQSSPFFCI